MISIRATTITASILFLALGYTAAIASPYDRAVTIEDFQEERVYSPFGGRNYPGEVLFGDTLFHTDQSFDAGLVGTKLGVDEGFRFTKGEKVISNSGQPVQLIRPLDFLVITDHAEFFG